MLDQLNKLLILVDHVFEDGTFNQIAFDYKEDQYLATKHLLEYGYKNISFIAPPKNSFNLSERMSGYIRALDEYGLPLNQDLILHGNFRFKNGFELAEELLNKGTDAILVSSDIKAYGVVKRISENKLKIPRDIAVVGYDDLIFSNMSLVSLTTIRQDCELLARKSIEVLIPLLEGISAIKNVVLKPELIIRKSAKQH